MTTTTTTLDLDGDGTTDLTITTTTGPDLDRNGTPDWTNTVIVQRGRNGEHRVAVEDHEDNARDSVVTTTPPGPLDRGDDIELEFDEPQPVPPPPTPPSLDRFEDDADIPEHEPPIDLPVWESTDVPEMSDFADRSPVFQPLEDAVDTGLDPGVDHGFELYG